MNCKCQRVNLEHIETQSFFCWTNDDCHLKIGDYGRLLVPFAIFSYPELLFLNIRHLHFSLKSESSDCKLGKSTAVDCQSGQKEPLGYFPLKGEMFNRTKKIGQKAEILKRAIATGNCVMWKDLGELPLVLRENLVYWIWFAGVREVRVVGRQALSGLGPW